MLTQVKHVEHSVGSILGTWWIEPDKRKSHHWGQFSEPKTPVVCVYQWIDWILIGDDNVLLM